MKKNLLLTKVKLSSPNYVEAAVTPKPEMFYFFIRESNVNMFHLIKSIEIIIT